MIKREKNAMQKQKAAKLIGIGFTVILMMGGCSGNAAAPSRESISEEIVVEKAENGNYIEGESGEKSAEKSREEEETGKLYGEKSAEGAEAGKLSGEKTTGTCLKTKIRLCQTVLTENTVAYMKCTITTNRNGRVTALHCFWITIFRRTMYSSPVSSGRRMPIFPQRHSLRTEIISFRPLLLPPRKTFRIWIRSIWNTRRMRSGFIPM